MAKVFTIHSFRRGVGKTGLAANLSVLLTQCGRRVAVIDTNYQSPGLHLFFELPDAEIHHGFNDYLYGRCNILSTARDVTSKVAPNAGGKLFILPSRYGITDIVQNFGVPKNIERYAEGLEELDRQLSPDIILVDAPAGLNEDTLQALAVSTAVVLVLRSDKSDFQGTAVTVDTIRRLRVPDIHLVLNDAPESLDVEEALRQLKTTYGCGGVVLNHSEELLALSSSRPFVLEYPFHPLTSRIGELADRLSP